MANARFSSPVGTAVYPRLDTPDTKFDELGTYKADISVPMAEAEAMMDRLTKVFKDHTGKALKKNENSMWAFETDDSGEETGNVIFKFRIKNRISKKTGQVWDRKPKQFDASLKPIEVNPWGGTKMAVSYEDYCWETAAGKKGVSLQPMAVQIIELREGSGPSGNSYGFGATEGYTAPDEAEGTGFQKGGAAVNDDYAADADDSVPDGADY